MSDAVNAAIAEAIKVLGPGWHIGSVTARTIRVDSYSESIRLPTDVSVILRHGTGIESYGEGTSIGGALDAAVHNLIEQTGRQGR